MTEHDRLRREINTKISEKQIEYRRELRSRRSVDVYVARGFNRFYVSFRIVGEAEILRPYQRAVTFQKTCLHITPLMEGVDTLVMLYIYHSLTYFHDGPCVQYGFYSYSRQGM